MANIKSAKKRAKQSDKRRLHKMAQRSQLRTAIKKVLQAADSGDKTAATEAYKAAVPVIDSLSNKGIVHGNKAARHKSRLNARLKAMA